MLADTIVEEEFEIKEEEPWYDKQDLEHDLQLAAELGKSLLERNRELEQGLQHMYSTNQEQLQEIEYLTKQVELLRQVNDQHAKVYEQLDVSARELEQGNHKLVLDNRAAQQKAHGLTETVEQLQAQVEELQQQVEELTLRPPQAQTAAPGGGSARTTHSLSCLRELTRTRSHGPAEPPDDGEASDRWWRQEEQASLQTSLQRLQTQFATERGHREAAEREAELLARENAALEQQLVGMEACQARVSELELEAEELRQFWMSESSSRSSRPDLLHSLLPDSMFLHPEEESDGEAAAARSARLVKGTQAPDGVLDHECSCVRRAEVVKYRGISLLNEVDAQYSALQVKYDELLRRCSSGLQEEDGPGRGPVQASPLTPARPADTRLELCDEDFHQPEYKELFREIFSRIEKTKEDLVQNRGGP
ncbi:cerebellar degeneration-related protein 2-like [Betta splendens]|uniref:Cerebellar degeneration-related protein 2-like n=1 Tax=Betta splendens TaxID=158456 RepID=A0A6P7L6K7_BETSP|nr:cerebellar degeneration-related protein 2-like [Betta splendens]